MAARQILLTGAHPGLTVSCGGEAEAHLPGVDEGDMAADHARFFQRAEAAPGVESLLEKPAR